MALNFSASIDRNILRVQQEINDKCFKISIELFLSVVRRTPSPVNKGFHATGLLVNQWYPKVGGGFSNEKTDAKSPDGAGSRARIVAIRGGREFFGKDGKVSLTNNMHYAYRAEMLGWPQPEWSGRVGPYRMVALALQEIATRYK